MRILFKKLRNGAVVPTRGSEYAAGYDLYACLDEPVEIQPGTNKKIGTGLSIAVPEGYFGAVFARSGLATKEGLRPANCVGICDSDYRGEYIVPVFNDSPDAKIICNGDRIAQLVILPFMGADFEETDELPETGRGEAGFGSTGK